MSNIAQVVDGEASESETEIEIGNTPETEIRHNMEPSVIAGEAPESDDESKISVPQSVADSFRVETPDTPTKQRVNFTSLLHQKLWECNVSLRATIEGLLHHTTEINVEKLTRADKMLLNVQESMRSTNANLTVARTRLKQLQTGLENVNCCSALPNVKKTLV